MKKKSMFSLISLCLVLGLLSACGSGRVLVLTKRLLKPRVRQQLIQPIRPRIRLRVWIYQTCSKLARMATAMCMFRATGSNFMILRQVEPATNMQILPLTMW